MNTIRKTSVVPTRQSPVLELERLTPALGALVHHLDLAGELSDALIDTIRDALDEHQVLFFHNQTLTPAQQRDFAARLARCTCIRSIPAMRPCRKS